MYLQQGRARNVKKLVEQALEEGISPQTILNDGLLSGMNVIGQKFKENEVFVPEVLVAARAMNMGMEALKLHLLQEKQVQQGKVVFGAAAVHMLPDLAELGAMMHHFGNAVPMEEVLPHMPGDVVVLGNVDPAGVVAHGSRKTVREAVSGLQLRCISKLLAFHRL